MDAFEQARAYFIDPRLQDGVHIADATHALVRGLQDPATLAEHDLAGNPYAPVVHELAADFQGARRFDHLSVAQLHPAGNGIGMLAHTASTYFNNNTIIGEVSPVETSYESYAVKWLLRNIAGYDPDKASGSLVSGGTSANHTALTIARERLQALGWDGRSPVKLFASQMAHYSVSKSARLLAPGGLIEVERVPLERGGYRMDPFALRERVHQAKRDGQPIMGIVAVAGETETGLIDDLDAIAEIAQEAGTYLHVDGAYGAPYRLSKARPLFEAMSASNSITCDPHKYMYVPYAAGAIMFADAHEHGLIEGLNDDGEGYMFKVDQGKVQTHSDFVNNTVYLGRQRIEGSMGGQAATALYMTVRHLGEKGLGALLDHNLEMTAVFAEEIAASPSLQLSFTPELNTACVEPTAEAAAAAGDEVDAKVEAVTAAMERDHGIYLSTTSLPKRTGDRSGKQKVFRFVSTHPYTEEDAVRKIAQTLTETWEQV
jgi:aromatic-L-amino-acid/L-tryptophan decarboxylase